MLAMKMHQIISCAVVLVALCMSPLAYGQVETKDAPAKEPAEQQAVSEKFNSPQATWRTFYPAVRDEQWGEAIKCLNLSTVSSQQAEELAIKLYSAIGKTGRLNDKVMPNAEQVKAQKLTTYLIFPKAGDPWHQELRNKYDDLPSITMAPNADGLWQFSAETVAAISKLADLLLEEKQLAGAEMMTFDQKIDAWVGPGLRESIFGLKYWQWLGLLILIVIGVILDHVVRLIVRGLTTRGMKRFGRSPDPEKLLPAAKAIGLLAMALFWMLLVNTLGFQGTVLKVLHGAASIFGTLVAVMAAWRFTDLASDAAAAMAAKTETNVDDVLIPLVRKALKIFIVVFGMIYGALSLDFNVMPLIGALGIGGLGFAFAAKDTLENFFGSATVLIDRPFTVGDWVVMDGAEGTVEEIGFRSTRVRTFYNSLITVPNANLVRANVDNYGSRKYRRYKTTLGLQYDTSHDKILAFTEGLRELVRSHPFTRKDYYHVYFHGYGPSSLDIMLYCFFEVPDWAVELRERERLNMDILRLADKLGVEFAFPTQTVHLYKEEHGGSHTPATIPEQTTDQKAQHMGARVAEQIMENQPWQIAKPGLVDYGASPVSEASDDEDEDTGKKSQIEQRGAGG
jgi:MscS family membrane protein